MTFKLAFLSACAALCAGHPDVAFETPQSTISSTGIPLAAALDAYISAYVDTNNFSGVVLLAIDGEPVLQKAYGLSDRATNRRNTLDTQFHVASLSMQFTAAAVMRLVDQGKLSLDAHLSDFVDGLPNCERITVRHLLEESSGLPDVNTLPAYEDILLHHQTPISLLRFIAGEQPRFEPGGSVKGEEHSAYNALALIVEKTTGLTFRSAVQKLVFGPLNMMGTAIDDDQLSLPDAAIGYIPIGSRGLSATKRIQWSAKTGNGSAVSTAADELKWINALFGGNFLSSQARAAVLDTTTSVGYGWFKNVNSRLSARAFYMSGRSPGFTSYLIRIPSAKLSIVVLSNVYVSVPSVIGPDVAALVLGKTVETPRLRTTALSPDETKGIEGLYRFDADFYQPYATLRLELIGSSVALKWPGGDVTYLLPTSKDAFIDRSYWQQVSFHRGDNGELTSLSYDSFTGHPASK